MQDRYAGDIGDFVKLGLLRALKPGKKLGVAWYRFPDEQHNKDGRHISYLEARGPHVELDPDLLNHLREVVGEARSITSLYPVLDSATFHDETLDVTAIPRRQRRPWREAWFSGVLGKLSDCDLVFADPDNGIVDDSEWRWGRKTFGKQIPLHEVKALARDRCAIIYHHNTRRRGGHHAEVDHWLDEFHLPSLAIRATAFSPRTFFVLNADAQSISRIREFCLRWECLGVRLHRQS